MDHKLENLELVNGSSFEVVDDAMFNGTLEVIDVTMFKISPSVPIDVILRIFVVWSLDIVVDGGEE